VGRDRWSATGLALLALGYLLAARRYPLDTLTTPGPGVVPMLAGVALLAIAIWLFLGAGAASSIAPPARSGVSEPRPSSSGQPRSEPVSRTPLPWSLAVALVVYAAVLPRLGFIVSSFALVALAARLMGARGWWRPAALALGVAGAGYWLFGRWLGVPLP
jgi:putative tricarboxylic transport membrane protein